jgi:hypothetical protein
MPQWNINQPATALSITQTVSQNPRECFSQTGLFSSFPMFLRIRGGVPAEQLVMISNVSQYRAKRKYLRD